MRKVVAHETIVHGVEHTQYFEGCGVSVTEYTDVATGIGSTADEAFEDALEQLAQDDWDVEGLEYDGEPVELPEDAHEELHVFVSVRVRGFKRFKLGILLGNDAMQTPHDVAEALRRVANQLDSGAPHVAIFDTNGNTVGTFELS